ncbi:oligosaccharide flippase family protein [Mycolicibacterium vaccae]|nr:oligosaccharide flippase family protein [Mycolicibacterium vaccae]
MNFIVVAIVGFIVNPLLLAALGPLMFGIWKSLQRYLDFATVADGRASQALKWVVASRSGYSDDEKRRDIGAAIMIWMRWLPAAAIVAGGVTLASPLLISGIPEDSKRIVYTAAAILAANTVLLGFMSVPDAVLTGVNQGYKSMLVTTSVFVASNGAMVVAAFQSWPLWSLAIIILTAAVINAAITLLVARRSISWWGIARPHRTDIRRVFGYSAWTLGWVVVDKLFLASELILISIMLGAVEVSRYTFTTYVMQFVLSIALVTASGFMPKLGAHLGASEYDDAAVRARSVRHLVMGLAVLGSSAVLAFNGAFVSIWVGNDQYLGNSLNALLVICGLQLALLRMDGQILDVTMRIAPKVMVGLFSSVGAIVSAIAVFAATDSLAIALLAIIAFRFVPNIAYPIFVSRAIPRSAVPSRALIAAAALLLLSYVAGGLITNSNPAQSAMIILVWFAAFCTAVWFGLLPRSTVRDMISRRR